MESFWLLPRESGLAAMSATVEAPSRNSIGRMTISKATSTQCRLLYNNQRSFPARKKHLYGKHAPGSSHSESCSEVLPDFSRMATRLPRLQRKGSAWARELNASSSLSGTGISVIRDHGPKPQTSTVCRARSRRLSATTRPSDA